MEDSSREEVVAGRGDSSSKDSDAKVEVAAPALRVTLVFSMKAVGLACAYLAVAVGRGPNHILAAVDDEDIHAEADKPVEEADRQPSFCHRFHALSGTQWASYWGFFGAR